MKKIKLESKQEKKIKLEAKEGKKGRRVWLKSQRRRENEKLKKKKSLPKKRKY